jgi:hypothetical protein
MRERAVALVEDDVGDELADDVELLSEGTSRQPSSTCPSLATTSAQISMTVCRASASCGMKAKPTA